MGAMAGTLGAMLGLGGGVFLVPFLVLVAGLPIKAAVGISLTTVIATSSSVSAHASGRQLINLRFGMLLEVATAAGGLMGGLTATHLSERTIEVLFAVLAIAVAVVMLSRLNRRNVIVAPDVDPGRLGARYYDSDLGRTVVYRVKRLPLALAASLLAGNVSSLLGVGGGIVKVPVLNAWCGMPLRTAAATSAFMIGVTATAGAIIYYGAGQIIPPLAAATVLGVLAGSRAGIALAARTRVRWLKILMACVLFVVAVQTWTLFDKVHGTYNDNVLTFDLRMPNWPFLALAWAGDFAAVLLIAPMLWSSSLALTMLTQIGIAIIACLAYNVLLGQGGMLSFGHAVYYGLGGFLAVHAMNVIAADKLPIPLPGLPRGDRLRMRALTALYRSPVVQNKATRAAISLGFKAAVAAYGTAARLGSTPARAT
jgi:uncharacterized membrane protein YfcA